MVFPRTCKTTGKNPLSFQYLSPTVESSYVNVTLQTSARVQKPLLHFCR